MNTEKLRQLWDGHAKAVYHYVLHLTHCEADAKDFLQEVFLRLGRQPELVERLTGDPRGYLLRLARNAVIDQARRFQARDRVFAKINALRQGESVDAEDPDNALLQQALADALRQLPREQREVVHARLWKKQTLDEIARALGVSINTVASRYRYGIDKMREALRSLYEDLAPGSRKTLQQKMKPNSENPFIGSPEEPIIQPLEQRRVPSATGAVFALPILPMPDDHDADADAGDSEISADDAGLETNGDILPLDDADTLPVEFDDIINTLDLASQSGLAEGGVDVEWAVGEVFDGEGPNVFHVMSFAGGVDGGDEGGDPSLAYTDYLSLDDGTAVTDGEVHDGEIVDDGSDGTMDDGVPVDTTTDGTDHATDGTDDATNPEIFYNMAGGEMVEKTNTDHADSAHTEADTYVEVQAAPVSLAAQSAAAPVAVESHADAHGEIVVTAQHDAAQLFTPIVQPHAPAASLVDTGSHEIHATADIDIVPLEHATDLHDASHDIVPLAIESDASVSTDHAVVEWVPVESLAATDAAAEPVAHSDSGEVLDHPIAATDAGLVENETHGQVRGSSMAMAATGAALLSTDAKTRGKKSRA